MKLYEYETKNILKNYGIPTPFGKVAANSTEAQIVADSLKPPFVLKAQVLVAGRGKAGGILFVENKAQVEEAAKNLFGKQIKDIPVKKILVEERIAITKEIYLAVTVDRFLREYIVIASTLGGMEIEETAAKVPQSIFKTAINWQEGISISNAQQIAEKLGYHDSQRVELARILVNLYRAGLDYDAELIEMNPLEETTDKRFVAVDARLIVDDNALFRHPDLEKQLYGGGRENTPEEVEAEKAGLAYVKLNGDIGVLGNGAGLVMATLDMIQFYGGKPADFMDLGGGAPIERIAKALGIVTTDPEVKVVLINILGGMTRCDEVARAIVETKNRAVVAKPFVVRLVGTNEEEARKILKQADIAVLDSMEKAAKHVVEIVKEDS